MTFQRTSTSTPSSPASALPKLWPAASPGLGQPPGLNASVAPALTLPLRNSVYRRLFSAQIVGLFGTGISTVALGLLAFSMGGGNAGQILEVVLALKVATYVSRFPGNTHLPPVSHEKKLLVTMDVVRALAIGSIAFVGEIGRSTS